MNTLQGLFIDFEYAPRAHIVTVPFAYVGVQPGASHHSIYEELWHLTKWQTFVLKMVRGEAVRSDFQEDDFPEALAPENEAAWQALVAEFLEGSEAAVTSAGDESLTNWEGRLERQSLACEGLHWSYCSIWRY